MFVFFILCYNICEVVFMAEKKKAIKLTVTEEMFNEITERARKMSISAPAFCCYVIGEKLSQYNLGEDVAIETIRSYAEDLLSERGKE